MTADARARLAAAVDAFRARDFARAVEGLRQAAAELPNDAMPWELLANAEAATGDTGAAMAALDTAPARSIVPPSRSSLVSSAEGFIPGAAR